MNDKKWQTFFDLIETIVNLPNLSASEKADLVRDKSREIGSDGDLEEFLAMLSDEA